MSERKPRKPKQPVHTRKPRAAEPQIPPARARVKAAPKAASVAKPKARRKTPAKVSKSVKPIPKTNVAKPKAAATKAKARKPKAKAPRIGEPGRKCEYSAALRDTICERIAKGAKWRDLEQAGIVTQYKMSTWLRTIPEFHEHYSRAREARAEWIVAEIENEIADLSSESTFTDQNNAKIRIEGWKWLVSCYYPRMYGTKLQVDATVHAANAVQYDYSRLSVGEAKTFRALMEKCRVVNEND